jgi:down-regulator of transcription 1
MCKKSYGAKKTKTKNKKQKTKKMSDGASLPKQSVKKVIESALPANVKVDNAATELLVQCCTEFVHLVANECAEEAQNTGGGTATVTHNTLARALANLGFDDYADDVKKLMDEARVERLKVTREKSKRKKRHAEATDEMVEQQQRLFQEAREQLERQLAQEEARKAKNRAKAEARRIRREQEQQQQLLANGNVDKGKEAIDDDNDDGGESRGSLN